MTYCIFFCIMPYLFLTSNRVLTFMCVGGRRLYPVSVATLVVKCKPWPVGGPIKIYIALFVLFR
jgi:hypothetical protein